MTLLQILDSQEPPPPFGIVFGLDLITFCVINSYWKIREQISEKCKVQEAALLPAALCTFSKIVSRIFHYEFIRQKMTKSSPKTIRKGKGQKQRAYEVDGVAAPGGDDGLLAVCLRLRLCVLVVVLVVFLVAFVMFVVVLKVFLMILVLILVVLVVVLWCLWWCLWWCWWCLWWCLWWCWWCL